MAIRIHTLELGSVVLPAWHPRAADGTCLIQGYAIAHPDGVIVFDTGTADDHPLIEELYHPTVTPIVEALNSIDIDERDVTAIVNSHLHFDHCGQNRSLPSAPVWVQSAEHALVDAPKFTVPDWARVSVDRRRVIDGDTDLTDGVRIVATPGHTPGHQSLVVESDGVTTILGGQCCYDCSEFAAGFVDPNDVHDESWMAAARESLDRLRAIDAEVVHLCHDANVLRSAA